MVYQKNLIEILRMIRTIEKYNVCSRVLSAQSEREAVALGTSMSGGPGGRRGQIALWPTREDDKYPSIRHCQAAARSELDAMQTHRKLCNIGPY